MVFKKYPQHEVWTFKIVFSRKNHETIMEEDYVQHWTVSGGENKSAIQSLKGCSNELEAKTVRQISRPRSETLAEFITLHFAYLFYDQIIIIVGYRSTKRFKQLVAK